MAVDDWAEDARQTQMLRMNVVRGKFNAPKFAALWTKLEAKYGREALERMAGYDGREKDLRALVGDAGKALPPKAQAALERRKEAIKSPDDLAAVVKLVLAETGMVAAQSSWIAFSVAGMSHMLVECTSETYGELRRLAEYCDEHGYRPDDVLSGLALSYMEPAGMSQMSQPSDTAEHAEASQIGSEGAK